MKVNVERAINKRAENMHMQHAKAVSAAILAVLRMAEDIFDDDPDAVRVMIKAAHKSFESIAEDYDDQFPFVADVYRVAVDLIDDMDEAFAKLDTTDRERKTTHDAEKFHILENELMVQYVRARLQGSDE